MNMKEISVKIAVGAITAMAAGIGSILGSEGAKAGLKALMNRPKTGEDPIQDLPEPIEVPTDTIETETVEVPTEVEVETEVEIPEDGA